MYYLLLILLSFTIILISNKYDLLGYTISLLQAIVLSLTAVLVPLLVLLIIAGEVLEAILSSTQFIRLRLKLCKVFTRLDIWFSHVDKEPVRFNDYGGVEPKRCDAIEAILSYREDNLR